jgi:TatD DNase family protein
MATYVDTHCNLPEILEKIDNTFPTLKKEFGSKYEACISVCSSASAQEANKQLMTHASVYGAFGVHPLWAEQYNESVEQSIIQLVKNEKSLAWGETVRLLVNSGAYCAQGLDFHKFKGANYAPHDLQEQVFEKQLKAAVSLNIPIIIHTREAEKQTLDLMKRYLPADFKINVTLKTKTRSVTRIGALLYR